MFGSSIRFSESADLMVQLSVTSSDPEPQFQGHSIVQRRISRKRCIRSTPCLVLGKGFRGRRIEWRYFRFDSIQDGGWWPSWNDGAVAPSALRQLGFLVFLCRSLRFWELFLVKWVEFLFCTDISGSQQCSSEVAVFCTWNAAGVMVGFCCVDFWVFCDFDWLVVVQLQKLTMLH